MPPIYYEDLKKLVSPINIHGLTDLDGLNGLMSGEWFGTYDIWGAIYDMLRLSKTSYDLEIVRLPTSAYINAYIIPICNFQSLI